MIQSLLTKLRASPIAGRVIRNLGWVVMSQGLIAIFGMITLAYSARALGAAGLGIIAVVEAYSRIVARLTHLEPWQATIRHGSTALEENDLNRLSGLIGLSTLIDIAGGLLAGGIAFFLAPLLAPRFNLTPDQAWLLSFGAVAALVSLRPTAIAVLRLLDRFDLLAKIDTATALGRMLLTIGAYLLGLELYAFVMIFIAFSLSEGLIAYLFARRELARREIKPSYRALRSLRSTLSENPGYLRLLWNSNLSVMWRQSTERLDMLILASLLSPSVLGFYHIARRIGEAALRLGRPLKQTIYPELTRLAARGDWNGIARISRYASLGFSAVLLVVLPPVILNMEWLVIKLFGESFGPAAPIVSIQSVAISFTLIGVITGPTLLSLERDTALVRLSAFSALLFFAMLVPMVMLFELQGAVISRLITNGIWLAMSIYLVRRTLRQLNGAASERLAGEPV